jgi:hypothetical protein
LGGESSISVDALDPNETFTQDHFMGYMLSDLKKHAHISAGENDRNHMRESQRPAIFACLSPGDFWLLGVLQNQGTKMNSAMQMKL